MIILLICLIIGMTVTQIILVRGEGFARLRPLKNEKDYMIHYTENVPREDLSSYIVTEENIYLYYEATGLVNVYSTDGSFRYGIQTDTARNDYGDIAFINGYLYIRSRNSTMYVFDDEVNARTFSYTENKSGFLTVERKMEETKKHFNSTGKFYYNSDTIGMTDKEGNRHTLIELPKKNEWVQTLPIFLCLAAAGLGYLIYAKDYGY